jgi:mRNA interferase MazF
VWWVEHPDWGRRPALVLTRQATISLLNSVLAAPATRTIRGIPSEAVLDREDGMPNACALSFDTAMAQEYFRERITRLSVARMDEVCRALSIATGCA